MSSVVELEAGDDAPDSELVTHVMNPEVGSNSIEDICFQTANGERPKRRRKLTEKITQ